MHSIWLKNWMSMKGLEQGTPYEALTGNKPDLAHLHEWGQKVWVHNGASSKLDGRAKEVHWIRFDSKTKGDRIFWPNRPRVSVEHNMRFDCDHVLITEPPVPVSPSTPSPTTPGTAKDRTTARPPDMLMGLDGPNSPTTEGCGARVK